MNMLVSDEQASVGPELDIQSVELLVSQPGSDPARFPLAEGKSTIGSSPSCQIRLSSESVRPLQCLIVRRGQAFTVTRWAAGIHLNCGDFTTSPLRPGDVLSIGDLRLELAGPAAPNSEVEIDKESPVALIDEVAAQIAAEVANAELPAYVADPQENLALADLARLRSANQQARQRFRRLVGALRQLRDEAHGLDNQIALLTEQLQAAQHAQERLSAELHQSQAIGAERESQIGEELDRAIAELTASYAKSDAASQEIESLRSRNQQVQEQIDLLSAELTTLRELCNGHEQEKLRFEQQLADREAQLAQVRDEIAQLQQNFQSSVAELHGQNESLQEQLVGVQRERERETAELQQGLEASVVELHEQNEILRNQLGELCSDHDRQIAELHGANHSLHSEAAAIAADRDRQIAELHSLNDSLRNDATLTAADRDRRIGELETLCASLQNELTTLAEERDRQLSESYNLSESLRHEAAAIAADRDRRIAELETLCASLQNELTILAEKRDRQLSESHNLSESLRLDTAAIAADRDRQIAELNGRHDILQAELRAVVTERDRELQELRDSMELSTRELRSEAERLTSQLAERAAERDRAIADLEQSHQIALTESSRQVESLHQQLAEAAAEQEQRVLALQGELEQARHAAEEAERLCNLPDPEKIELEGELQTVRSERQKLAEEKHHLTLQFEDAEKRCKLLEIDVRSVNAEWQRSQSTVSRLQDELITAQAHAADLDAKLCDFHCTAEVDRAVDCDTFAGDLAAVRQELDQREQTLAESLASSEQLRGQLQTTEQELAACREDVAKLGQQIADLQAVSAETEKERASLDAQIEESTAQIDALNEAVRLTEQTRSSELVARDERIAGLNSEIATVRSELATAEATGVAQAAELTHLLDKLQEAATDAAGEQTRLVAAIADCESRIAELTATATETQRSNAVELADRDSRINTLATELEDTRNSLRDAANQGNAQIAELTAALAQSEQELASEAQSKETLIAEHAAEFATLQNAISAELATRDTKIAELSTQLEHIRSSSEDELSAQQHACEELQQQLLEAQEKTTVEFSRREEQITELTRELHDTQDQLADCAAQGERLAELYRQAQADLAALSTSSPAQVLDSAQAEAEPTAIGNEQLQTAEPVAATPRADDPRDNDEPRLERALACLTVEPPVAESNTKTVAFQPSSFIDRYSHIFDENSEVQAPEPIAAQHVAELAPELNDIVGDDSAALEAYMANMMKRVRGETSSDSIVPPVPREPVTESATFSNPVARMSTLTERVASPATVETNGPEEEKLICLNELKQTSQKPPLPTSLSAMRELANTSARQAIAKHRKRRHFEGALSKFLVSGIAGGTAAYMLFTATDYLSTYFLAGCGVAVVSGYWGFKLLGILLEIIRDGINHESTPAELDDSASPLPIDGVSS